MSYDTVEEAVDAALVSEYACELKALGRLLASAWRGYAKQMGSGIPDDCYDLVADDMDDKEDWLMLARRDPVTGAEYMRRSQTNEERSECIERYWRDLSDSERMEYILKSWAKEAEGDREEEKPVGTDSGRVGVAGGTGRAT